jgi:tRNA(adenine34) deaminase
MANEAEDIRWMRRALALARMGQVRAGANPIGCVIVRDGKVIAEAHNEVDIRHDPTAHAEMVAIRRAGAALCMPDLRGATLYSTLQPCGMCTMAAIWSKIRRVVFGAGRQHVHSMYFEERHLDTLDFIRDAYRRDLTLTPDVLSAECASLYVPPGAEVPVSQQFNR